MPVDLCHRTKFARGRFVLSVALFVFLGVCAPAARAENYTEGFESETPSWVFVKNSSQAKVHRKARTTEIFRSGQRSEALEIETLPYDGRVEIVHKLPPAVRFDELKASVWLWSNHPGVQVSVRVRLPQQLDQRTGQSLVAEVYGDLHSGGGQWQRLAVDLSDRSFEETMRRVRSDLARRVGIKRVNDQGAYVDQISLRLATHERVTWDLKIDDLELTQFVPAALEGTSPDEANGRISPRVRIGDDRVLLDGQPFFPLIIPDHGESVETLAQSNCSVVWIADYEDRKRLQELSGAGLGVMATPPQPDLETDTAEQAGLLPFTAHTDPILFWMLDVQIPPSRLQQASAWAEMVRDADRQRARPIMADVMGKEREYHRELSFLGASRSILHTTKSPRIYADTLDLRRRMALPGKPEFTLISTEPAEELVASRPARLSAPVVEPEQIWMQANIALAAGFKGIGYLSFRSLESEGLGFDERRLAIEIMNYRIRVLEPWLATAKVLQQARVQVGKDASPNRSPLLSSWDVRPGVKDDSPSGIAAQQIQATVLECDQGLMILVNWLEDNAQYQPGRMVAQDVRLLVNRDIVQATEMTTTGLQQHTLDWNTVAGGTEILIKDFNQSAVILVTSDRQAMDALNEQLVRVRPMVSEAWSKLGRAKVNRVRGVHQQLVNLAPPVTNAEPVLREASHLIDLAEKAHAAGKYADTEDLTRRAMAYMRDLQQTHWKIAVGRDLSPASSPHALCFQTLPDHWRMKESLKQATRVSDNLLPSGSFDDADAVLVGWTRTSGLAEDSPIRTIAELVGPPGAASLSLGAGVARDKTPPSHWEQTLVSMVSPPMPVAVGQIIRVQGRIQIKQPLQGTTDGLLVYDSLVGTVGALRFRESTPQGEWQEFEFTREVANSGEMRLMFDLKGIGTVSLDDLRVTATDVTSPVDSSAGSLRTPR